MRRKPRQHEGNALSFTHGELRDVCVSLWLEVDLRPEHQSIGAAEREQRLRVEPPHPRHDRAVVEPDHELRAHGDRARQTFDDAHHVRLRLARRHEVDHADASGRRLPLRFEHQGVLAITPVVGSAAGDRPEQPAAVLTPAEQGGEARARVEPRKRQPVDRAAAADERGGLQVAEQGVVLDPLGHYLFSSSSENSGSLRATARLKSATNASALSSSSVCA